MQVVKLKSFVNQNENRPTTDYIVKKIVNEKFNNKSPLGKNINNEDKIQNIKRNSTNS